MHCWVCIAPVKLPDTNRCIRLYPQDSSPLLVAAAAGQAHTTQALLAGGALTDAPSSTGETAMIVAATHGHVRCMAVLRAYNAGRAKLYLKRPRAPTTVLV